VIRILILLIVLSFSAESFAQRTLSKSASQFRIARLKYSGGGDWYNDPSCEPNLLRFVRQNSNIDVNPEYIWVDVASDDIFNYPFLFLTGHGNVEFTESEVKRLRSYLDAGGFLYIDDDYGLDKSIRRELKRVFPDQDLQELPFSNPIFHSHFDFPNGVPKTHEHDKKEQQTFGLFTGKRLSVLYTFESNPSDGWADPDIHNTPPEKRQESLKFGMNIIVYVLSDAVNQ
jgi:hypothetical protein